MKKVTKYKIYMKGQQYLINVFIWEMISVCKWVEISILKSKKSKK